MMENYKLSKEEKEILKSFENLKINHGADKTDNSMKEKQMAMQAAESFTKKSERINYTPNIRKENIFENEKKKKKL